MAFNIPIVLTWHRVFAIPLLVLVFMLPFDGIGMHARNVAATVLFVLAAVTDWADGYLARRLGQQTAFGAFLDPVADKLLVCVALVMLMELGRVGAVVTAIIIGREITISALREWMASLGKRRNVAVNSLGKLKTISQLVAIPLLLYSDPLFGGRLDCRLVGTWLLYFAAFMTLWSMGYYLHQAWPSFRGTMDQ